MIPMGTEGLPLCVMDRPGVTQGLGFSGRPSWQPEEQHIVQSGAGTLQGDRLPFGSVTPGPWLPHRPIYVELVVYDRGHLGRRRLWQLAGRCTLHPAPVFATGHNFGEVDPTPSVGRASCFGIGEGEPRHLRAGRFWTGDTEASAARTATSCCAWPSFPAGIAGPCTPRPVPLVSIGTGQ